MVKLQFLINRVWDGDDRLRSPMMQLRVGYIMKTRDDRWVKK